MSEGVGSDNGHTGYVIHVEMDEKATADDLVVNVMRQSKKLDVESYSEVYYPSVSFVKTEKIEKQILDKLEIKESTPIVSVCDDSADGKSRQRKRGIRKVWSGFGLVIVGVVATCAMVLVGLRLAGFRTLTVMSGSMEPNYPVGSMIYVKPVDYKTLKVGDVISYVAGDDKTIVTHRIDEIEVDGADANVLRFRTKGDANATADSKLVHYKNVLGTPIITIPFIGYFAHNIQQPPGIYIALVAGTLLLAWTFLPGTLEERRKTARKSVA